MRRAPQLCVLASQPGELGQARAGSVTPTVALLGRSALWVPGLSAFLTGRHLCVPPVAASKVPVRLCDIGGGATDTYCPLLSGLRGVTRSWGAYSTTGRAWTRSSAGWS